MRRNAATAIALALLLVPALAFGQIKLQKARFAQKGKIHFGGAMSYSSMTDDDSDCNNSDFSFRPQVGYFVMPGLEIGGIIDYHSHTHAPDEGDDSSSSELSLGPRVAYYHKVSPVIFPFGHASLVYMVSADDDAWGDTVDSVSGYTMRLGVGMAVPFGHKVGGVLSIGLDYVKKSYTTEFKTEGMDDQETELSGFELGTGITIYFGG